MRFLFLCGCLEPGKDGVGDYTRLLAGELIKAGHQVYLIALYDHFVSMEVEEIQIWRDTKIKASRLSKKLSSKERLVKTKEKFKKFNPDWVSIQFVAYSFHSKGLNFRLPFLLDELSNEFHWHIMIHEPWLSGRRLKYKHQISGFIQKTILKLIVKKLAPKVLHTSNSYYQEILRKGGIECSLLNLPGNIPIHKSDHSNMLKEFSELGITQDSRKRFLVLGAFGTMRPQMSYVALLESQIKLWGLENKTLAFFSIGKTGAYSSPIFEELKRKFKDGVLLHQFGERTPCEISSFFQFLDYGVASVPHHLLGKSGAYAAMRNHGLKILVPEIKAPSKKVSVEENNTGYLLKIPDEDFSSERVTKGFLRSLKTDLIQSYS